MRLTSSTTTLSPTDLSAFAECSHRTLLDFAAARKLLKRPGRNEIEIELLEKRGREHEARVLAHFQGQGLEVHTASLHLNDPERGARETVEAMERRFDVIYQGTLLQDGWVGRPDFLLKVDDGHYEPADAKLARSAKAAAILQLCAYVEALGATQARAPEHFHLALGTEPLELPRLRAADFMAYYRRAKAQLGEFVREIGQREDLAASIEVAGEQPTEGAASREGMNASSALPYPEPVSHCGVCDWWKRCEDRRRADDHLSLVASITRKQRDRLTDQGTTRVTELAALSPNVRVPGIEPEPLTRIREQARIQVEGREEKRTKHELLADFDPGSGLEALPKPSPGDLFFDLEGDAFYESTALEYLFGLVELGQISRSFTERTAAGPPKYLSHWATSRAEEKAAFEAVIDRIQAGRAELAEMHVYHFGHREADAVRRLSCFHKTREDAVDDMLRNHVFVDLHRIVRQCLRASVESYSLKLLEPLYGFTRKTEVRDAARAMQLFGRFLELGGPDGSDATRDVIASYNEEDCLSTWKLREFLEAARPRLEAELGRALARPKEASSADDEAQKRRAEKDRVLQEVVADLTRGLPEDAAEDSDEAGARRLLSVLLDFHWREAKSGWWEYYRAAELAPSERLEDSAALAGLQFVRIVEEVNRSAIYRYAFPQQRHAIRTRGSVDPDSHEDPNKFKSVNVVAIGEQHVDIKRQRSREREHPSALIPGGPINTEILKESLLELGRQVVAAADGDVGTAAWDLLRRHPPRLTSGAASSAALQLPGESEAQALLRMVPLLDGSVLSMQGPPGSGKTYLAAQLIGHLVEQGQRVGVTAGSHSVIRNLLDKAVEIGAVAAQRVAHHGGSSDDASVDDDDDTIARSTDYKKLRATLDSGKVVLVGGTAWAWANDAMQGTVDTLIVDEAGQMSLANVVAACRGTRNLVLVGDPAQLSQPSKGVHPPGTERSALEHVLSDAATMPEHLGLFLRHTRRLHPAICGFTSDIFYAGRLSALPELAKQQITAQASCRLAGAGLRFVPVRHDGNTDESEAEAAAIAELIDEMLAAKAQFVDEEGRARALTRDDMLVVAPYNMQVNLLRSRLPGVRVGTVDKFQGKEAPVVFFSSAASSIEDAPRGAGFLLDPSRLNVATSRARALSVIVASPSLLAARCRTPEQIKLVNALCAFVERAEMVTWGG